MINQNINAVALKEELQKKAEQKLAHLSKKDQLELLREKFGHLMKGKSAPENIAV